MFEKGREIPFPTEKYMLLGKVIGTIWATRKDEKLEGTRLLIVKSVDLDLKPLPSFVIAVDTVSAGLGELVLVAQGSSARQTKETSNKPVDAVIMAIVENMNFDSIENLDKEFEKRKAPIEKQLNTLCYD
jgi:microcompartment protein CcmK/EutM